VLNHTTRREDVDAVLELLATAEAEVGVAVAPLQERHPTMADDPLERSGLFAGLPRADVERIAANGEVRDVAAGATVVERWEASREFFVVLDGTVSVSLDGAVVASLGPGDYFGELAALDWGAGFGYPRLATVVAESDLRVLVIAPGALAALLRDHPLVEERVRASARDRLGRR
jgi:CRP-like cAMP-binding protein